MHGTGQPGPGSNLSTVPGTTPSPATPGHSAEEENSVCMPRHTPRKAAPEAMYAFSGPTYPPAVRADMAPAKLPTPGNTSTGLEVPMREVIWDGSVMETMFGKPEAESAFFTERMLPAP
jgi:hypothetical protein